MPLTESGERHLYLATSSRYPPMSGSSGSGAGLPLREGGDVAQGTNGKVGSGVYSVGWDGESLSPAAQDLLAGLRDRGMVEEIWRHTESEFNRITGA